MPKLDGLWVLGEFLKKPFQSIRCFACTAKTGRKLKQDTAELSGLSQRCNALFELADIRRKPKVFLVSELLPCLDRKLKAIRRTSGPIFRRFGGARAVEGGIHFHRIEVSRIEFQLVRAGKWIENSGPGTGTAARGITPAAGPDAPDSPGFVGITEQAGW